MGIVRLRKVSNGNNVWITIIIISIRYGSAFILEYRNGFNLFQNSRSFTLAFLVALRKC